MRSQIQFVMHPDDERTFAELLLADESVRFVDGPRWPSQEPTFSRSLDDIGWYCIIWSTDDVPQLTSRYIATCDDWYITNEYATLQMLRSEVDGSTLTDGRVAISTHYDLPELPEHNAKQIDARFSKIRRHIMKHYVNSIIRWHSSRSPVAPRGPKRSPNPSDPDKKMWVGPAALQWFHESDGHCIRCKMSGVTAIIEKKG